MALCPICPICRDCLSVTNATQVMSDLSVLRFDLGLKVWLNTPYQVKRGIPRDTPERVRLDKVGQVCYTYPTSPPKGEQPLGGLVHLDLTSEYGYARLVTSSSGSPMVSLPYPLTLDTR